MPRLPPVHQCPPPTSLMQGAERQGGLATKGADQTLC